MSKRAILLLAVVTALLIGYVVVFERGSVTSKELAARSGRVLVDFVRDKVDQIELQRKGKTVTLVRVKLAEGELGGWQMRAPVLARADTDAIDALLGELEWLSARRTFGELSAADAQKFGLDKPRYRLTYHVAGRSHTFAIGHDDVHGDGVYLRIDDEARAFVVPKSVLEPMNRDPGHFRDKHLFPSLVVEWARRLVVTRGEVTVDISKDGEDFWLEGSPRVRADRKQAKELFELVAGMRATRYLEADEQAAAERALATPSLRVSVATAPDQHREDKQPEQLAFVAAGACGAHPDERYARTLGGPVVCMLSGDLKALDIEPTTVRDRHLVIHDVREVRGIELVQGDRKLVLTREGDQWKASGGAASDGVAIESWLLSLAAAEATGFHPDQTLSERGALTLTRAGDKRERIAIGTLASNGDQLLRRDGEQVVVSFPPSVADRLQPSAGRFASLDVWSAHQPSQVVALEAQVGGNTRKLVLADNTWRARDDSPIDADRTRVLVRELVDLHVRSYLSDQPRPALALAQPTTRLRMTLRDGKQLTLAAGAATERGRAARIDDHAVVEVAPEVVAVIEELAGARSWGSAPSLHEEDEEDDDEDESDAHDHGHDHAH